MIQMFLKITIKKIEKLTKITEISTDIRKIIDDIA